MKTIYSARTRALAYIIATVSLALFVILFHQLHNDYEEFQQELDKRVAIHLDSVIDSISNRLWELDYQGLQVVIDGFAKDPDFAFAQVLDVEGILIAHAKGNYPRDQVTSKRLPVVFGPHQIVLGEVYLELSHERLMASQRQLLTESLIIYCLTLIAVIAVIVSCFNRITNPLDELTKVMKNLADDRLNIPIPFLERNDEIGQISKAVRVFQDYALDRQALMIKQAENEKLLTFQAHYDALTSLPNRFLTMDRLSHQILEAERSEERVAVMFVDLDDFKKINDTLGHETGDKLLIETAGRLRSTIRKADTVGRLGGDEFVIVVGNIRQPEDVRPIAEQCIHRLRELFCLGEHELLVVASVGISIYPDDGLDTSDLLRKADSAMYHAKEEGGNSYAFFTEQMNRRVSRRLAIEQAMNGALQRGEFEVVYQPIVDANSAEMIATEALLRWHSHVLGQVRPDEFIPIAEQNSLIVELGEFVLQDALKHTAEWVRCSQRCLRASVNISPRQFRDPKILEKIKMALDAHDIAPGHLTLELTEGVLLSGDVQSQFVMEAVNKLGISIAMDDFGTGYSSLSYLRSFPFNVLKVDRSFVSDITYDKADGELVQAAIAMAHSLNLKVVGEGVESQEQLEMLQQMGCDYVQGYYLGKPMAAELITAQLLGQSFAVS